MEQHGGKSETIVGVLTSCWSSLQSGSAARQRGCKKWFGGSIMNHHENKRERLERLGQKLKTGAGTQIGVPICFTEYPQLSSLAAELWTPCCPLPVRSGGGKPFVQGWTHTHTHTRTHTISPLRRGLWAKTSWFPTAQGHAQAARTKDKQAFQAFVQCSMSTPHALKSSPVQASSD